MVRQAIVLGVLMLIFGVTATAAQVNTLRDASGAAKERRGEARQAAKERWEELKTARETKREEVKGQIQAKREETKANIQNLRNERKKQTVQRVQTKLGEVNGRRTDHFLKVLARLSTVLDKIQSRTEKAKAEGKNVSSIETAISSARTAISSAESAVNAQKEKTYQITVIDDTTARNEVGAITKQLQEDLRAVQDTVQVARSAVQNVFKEIKTIVGSNKGTTPSATGSSAAQ